MEVVVLRKPEITEILIKRDEYKKYKNWKKKNRLFVKRKVKSKNIMFVCSTTLCSLQMHMSTCSPKNTTH